MKLQDYDYFLPEELIAQVPIEPRDHSRLMVLNRQGQTIEHHQFKDIINYINPGDALVVNNTRVLPARLFGTREGTGAKIEIVLLIRKSINQWEVLIKPGKKAKPGTEISFGDGRLKAKVIDTTEVGGRIIEFNYQGSFEEHLEALGQMPLPPYITAELEDKERYQTIYSKHAGSAAAPTAGLHFTDELITQLKAKGIEIIEVMLHVGLGTFRPVKTENILEHKMHAEYYQISPESAKKINKIKDAGGRIIAVGTTSSRTLETAAKDDGRLNPDGVSGWTDIFIYPGYKFKLIDSLITNFHLPKSTLLMLISALADREFILRAYEEAVQDKYRFFSFGDAMLII